MEVLYEDNHIIAVNKMCGDIVQGDKTGDKSLSDEVKDYLIIKYNKPGKAFLGLIHRLDRPTSGVILFAKTSKALSRMNEQFRSRKDIHKTYWALTEGFMKNKSGKLEHHLKRNRDKNKSFTVEKTDKEAKKAELSYKVLGEKQNISLLEIDLHTGRHHQIRVQFSAEGHSILGDVKYGSPQANLNGGICLHARKLSFIHPVNKEPVTITAPLPTDDPHWTMMKSITRKS